MAGSITAALFLDRFVERAAAWAHFDIYGWNNRSRPGAPGGRRGARHARRVRLAREPLPGGVIIGYPM